MTALTCTLLQPDNTELFNTIAGWYHEEWKIPTQKTIQNLHHITSGSSQFQALLMLDNIPVATGGIYSHVGLIDREPRFGIYNHWLSLVYTMPEHRHKGYGAELCSFISEHAMTINISKLHLFTDTAESLYTRLGWTPLERVSTGGRNVVVMEQDLAGRSA
jgi:GNAT superfamily N-acetyltransferase